MQPRILIVDDEPNVLTAYQRVLHKLYECATAASAAAALELIAHKGPFAVVVSDMKMPGASGLTLLKHVQRFQPDVVRIMLTGADDQKTAIDAVNSGQVFRFLHKPCPGHIFLGAIQEAVEHHQVGKRERELLEKTFTGVVDMLMDMLASTDPQALRQAQRLRDRALQVTKILEVAPTWEVESAALLFRIGVVTLPGPVLAKLRDGGELSETEQTLVDRMPEIGARLLDNIPRLAPVAAIVRNQRRGFDGSGTPTDGPSGCELPVGARILRPLLDIRELEQRGRTYVEALNLLRHDIQFYDPDVMRALEDLKPDDAETTEQGEYRMATELRAGMTLASDAVLTDGLRLIIAGTKLTGFLIARLHNFSDLGQLRQPLFIYPKREDAVPPPAAPPPLTAVPTAS